MHFKNLMILCLFLFLPLSAFAEESIGQKDESMESHLLFLRDTTVLLQKGDQRIGVSFSMTNDEQRVFTTTVSQRTYSLALSYSLGVGYGAEVFASIPASHTKTKKYDFLFEASEEESISSFNNAVLGLKKTLIVQNANRPELVGALSFSSPITEKSKSYPTETAVNANLTVIKSIDPVVLYGGISFTHPFRGEEGNSYGFKFGSAFAVNHKIAFGGELSMNEMRDNKTTLSPTSILTLRETYSASKSFSVEPSISFGLSDDSPDNIFGLSFSWRL